MKRIYRLALVTTMIVAASAQQAPAQQRGQEEKQERAAEARDISPLKALLKSSLTGCLSQGDEADPFILTVSDTGARVTVTGAADLVKHVGHTVKVHGGMKSEGRYFHATEVEHVASSCIEGKRAAADDSEAAARKGGVTADQQSNKPSDQETTREIRQAIVQDKSLSLSAHNVKIITRNGVVTLRGPVRSEQEKASIQAYAASVAGAANIQNELTVYQKVQETPEQSK